VLPAAGPAAVGPGPSRPAGAVPDTILRPPWDRRRIALVLALGLGGAAAAASLPRAGISPTALVAGLSDIRSLVARMLPPHFPDLAGTVRLVLETFLMAFAGTVLSLLLTVPLAVLAARNTTTGRIAFAGARAVIAACRAVPDLVFALVFVRALGLGVLPGILALALHSVGMLGKLLADAVEGVPPGPLDAIRSAGGSRGQVLAGGVLPQVVPTMIGTFLYRLDINVRLSTVLGFVGAGGIGLELRATLGNLRYQEALGIVIVIFALIVAVEAVSVAVRHTVLADPRSSTGAGAGTGAGRGAGRGGHRLRPPWTATRRWQAAYALAFGAVLVASATATGVNPLDPLLALPALWDVARQFVPPDLRSIRTALVPAMVETVAIGVAATVVGSLLSVPLAFLAARNLTPNRGLYLAARGIVLAVRGVPELVLAVIFVAAVGLGPFAGALALGIATVGFMAKLLADALEELDQGPRDALDATGATRTQQTASAVVPQAMPALVANVLYMLDINVRSSVILGIVGAGGIGFLLVQSVRTLEFQVTAGILACVFVVVYGIERLSAWLRSHLL
jgi:phosphonate transport system permease protein